MKLIILIQDFVVLSKSFSNSTFKLDHHFKCRAKNVRGRARALFWLVGAVCCQFWRLAPVSLNEGKKIRLLERWSSQLIERVSLLFSSSVDLSLSWSTLCSSIRIQIRQNKFIRFFFTHRLRIVFKPKSFTTAQSTLQNQFALDCLVICVNTSFSSFSMVKVILFCVHLPTIASLIFSSFSSFVPDFSSSIFRHTCLD